MPSVNHEAILELFRRRPMLARELLDVRLPPHVQLGDTTLSEVVPTERKADLVLLFSTTPKRAATCAVVVEVQLRIDREKRWSWWWYLVSLHARVRAPAAMSCWSW
jgi:hypothetical protein